MDTELNTETRYQVLPSEEEWNKIFSIINDSNKRMVVLDKVTWTNKLTKTPQTVYNIPVYANNKNGDRLFAVTQLDLGEILLGDEELDNDQVLSSSSYVFNTHYAHVNVSSTPSRQFSATSYEDTDKGRIKRTLYIHGQSICCPLTNYHMYTTDEKNIKLLLKGQLMYQNTGSPFQTVESVYNNHKDYAVRDSNGNFIANTAPIVQLITQHSFTGLDPKDTVKLLKEKLQNRPLPTNENEVMVKLVGNSGYTAISKDNIDELDTISHYYPVLTYEMIKNITMSLPKTEMDIACFGLGSAGTNILDQFVRSSYFNSYFLCDKDIVSKKNLRNQWYIRNYINNSKVSSSQNIIYTIQNEASVLANHKWVQDMDLSAFKFKYVISGFDSIDVRQYLYNKIADGTLEAEYLIDTRYADLTASVFMIDLKNEKQCTYYENLLKADYEYFKEQELARQKDNKTLSFEEFVKVLTDTSVFDCNCSDFKKEIRRTLGRYGYKEDIGDCPDGKCKGAVCLDYWKEIYELSPTVATEAALNFNEELNSSTTDEEGEGCVRRDIIDVYKYASSYVFAAVREIENESEKPFTHIEVSTEGIPSHMVVKKD